MKGTVDKLLNFMKLSDDEEYDEEYEEYEDDEEEEEEPRSTFSFFKKKEPEVEEESSNSKISQPFDNTITASREAKKRRFTSTGSKVVSMNGRGVEVYVIKPQDFAEAQTAADLLKEGRTVVINLEGVELTVAQRSIDFVGGGTPRRHRHHPCKRGQNKSRRTTQTETKPFAVLSYTGSIVTCYGTTESYIKICEKIESEKTNIAK